MGIVHPHVVSGCVSSTELLVTEVDQADIAILIVGGDTWCPGSWPVASGTRVTVSCPQSTDCCLMDIQTLATFRAVKPASSIPMVRSLRFPISRGILEGGGNWILTICLYSPRSKEEDYHSRFYLALPNHGERAYNDVSLVTCLTLLVSSFLGIRHLSDHNSTVANFVSNENSRQWPSLSQNCDKKLAFLLLLSIYIFKG